MYFTVKSFLEKVSLPYKETVLYCEILLLLNYHKMTTFKEINSEQAWEILNNKNAVLVDIRDLSHFIYSRPQSAFHLTHQRFSEFQQKYEYDQPIIVSCYHGVSSRNVAQFLVEQGYDEVYSLIGGFAGWVQANLPWKVDIK